MQLRATLGTTIRGSDFIYADNGKLLLTKQDLHLELEHTRELVNNNVIGDINADWKAGLNNTLLTKLSFLLDMQKRRRCFLLTHGMVMLQECMFSFNNELGNQV
jgi:hypothetical protein